MNKKLPTEMSTHYCASNVFLRYRVMLLGRRFLKKRPHGLYHHFDHNVNVEPLCYTTHTHFVNHISNSTSFLSEEY
jgi:hypothetical protein